MSNAIFIKNNSIKYLCNICSEEIDEDKIIGLKCNPDKHIFCYDCIIDWYKQLKFNKKYNNNYNTVNMCPICRGNGGLIPIYGTDEPIKNIHFIPKIHNTIKCGIKLLTKNSYCTNTGKSEYNNLCGLHAHLYKPTAINNDNNFYCGFKLLTKDGFCKLTGKSEYNNLCKVHFLKNEAKINSNIIQENIII